MFAKLGQRSTSWWICVTITGIFAASLLTVVAYPVYALCAGVCTICGSAPNDCSDCNTGLNGGEFRHEAALNTFAMWLDTGASNCVARVNTYHSVQVTNESSAARTLTLRYKSLVKMPDNYDPGNCPPHAPSISGGTWSGSMTVPAGQNRIHTRKQSVTWQLADPSHLCEYRGQAVTQVNYGSGLGNADVQCVGPSHTVVCHDELEYTEFGE